MSVKERTSAGDTIYRYDSSTRAEFREAQGDSQVIDAISAHIRRYLGPDSSVFHERVSDTVHIDIHWVKPAPHRPFFTLITSGMSAIAMPVPSERKHLQFSELFMLLPPDWKISENTKDFLDEDNYWPLRWLKTIARFPHLYSTWLGAFHTIPNGEKALPFARNTKFGCMMLAPSFTIPREFHVIPVSSSKVVVLYCLLPLYSEEMNFKLQNGAPALMERLSQISSPDIVDINRPNVCAAEC